MKTYRTEFEMEIDIKFSDPEKAYAYFINGDWKKGFYTCCDLEELSELLSEMFHNESRRFVEHQHQKDVEGFSPFRTNDENKEWTSEYHEYGKIIIKYEFELAPAGTYEID